ncbi:ABC transporter permease [Streptomyces sp. NPDC059837]|uniref:ABC transporter permease n=1 Tax=unclassified Streptomyces TaxID=2593676 RepID=UPI0022554650|nr:MULTISPECIES: ABC transporter permease [unclassified Streptomyces]MCX4408861.1 ABC transporter permease [Streptomyces sp. NBC_01764]MCX5185598.1 ABC transporter permease [Streptomyces sp. NBC_00268]
MTALTAPGSTAAPPRRPSTSRGLIRAVLLLHRPALYIWAGLFVALGALLLWLYGPGMDAAAEAWRQYDRCTTANCSYDQDALLRYKSYSQYATFAVTFLPLLVAAWSGASLVGREMENGTAHLAWTQSISPARWLAVKLTLPAALITAGTSVLVALHHQVWARSQGRIHSAKNWSESLTFHANGPTTVAFALCGLALGALAGLTLRRSLGALVVATLATGAVRIAVGMAQPHLWPTVRTVSSLKNDGPVGGGLTLHHGLLTSTGTQLPDPYCGSSRYTPCRHLYDRLDAVSFYSDWHPYSHYWPLQLVATGLTLVITALAAFVAFRLLNHRTGTASKEVRQ